MSVATTGNPPSGTQGGDVDAARILQWEGCFNVRDLGGLATNDGRRTRWGALVRSDVLCRLTESGRNALVGHGVRTIVDLRFVDEVAIDWDSYPFRDEADGADGVRYMNVPFDTGRDPATQETLFVAYVAAPTRAVLNRLDLDWNARGIASALSAIAEAPAGGVLVHCHGGKDRTGMVVALLLSLVGVHDDDVANDYALTAANLEPLIIEWLDKNTSDAAERDRLTALATPTREAMLDSLAYLRERYGSIDAYLREGGLTDAVSDQLRARVLEPA